MVSVNESVLAAAEVLVGKMQVEFLRRLLRAAKSNNTVEDMFRAAISSKAKSEYKRLKGIVLSDLHDRGNVTPTQLAEICRHLGIGGTREVPDYLDEITAPPVNPKVQPAKPANGS